MLKVSLLIALAIVGASAQNSGEAAGAPEPYAYAYETDSHAASEQRDANGKVTGFYTIADADGRARRVEYIADEAGFRAKIQTNEVGTKSENPADVEVLASPPTQEQFTQVYQAPAVAQQQYQVVQQQAPRVVSQQFVQAAAPAVTTTGVRYVQQPQYASYGYTGYTGYPAGYGYGYQSGLANQGYRYGVANTGYSLANTGYSLANTGYGVANNGVYGVYSASAPASASYYRTVTSNVAQPASYGSVSRYVSSVGNLVAPVAGQTTTTNYRNYQTVGVPSAVSYQTTSGVQGASGVTSPNYLVLKKRDSEAAAAAATDDKKKN